MSILGSRVDRNRRPDVAIVSAQTIAQAPPQPGSDNAWDVVPELMVAVVSDYATDNGLPQCLRNRLR